MLRGSGAAAAGGAPRSFDVPTAPARDHRIARLVAGEAWPTVLAPIDRIAPIPVAAHSDMPPAAEGGVPVLYVEAEDGSRVPLCVVRPGGTVAWGVDPADWIEGILTERYVRGWIRPLPSRLPFFNYSHLPHAVKGLFQRFQDPRRQPSVKPVEFPCVPLDDFVDVIRRLCHTLAFGREPEVDRLWPHGHRAAITVTHDVDTSWILDGKRGSLLREILARETSLGLKGAWYVPGVQLHPARHAAAIARIAAAGHELGCHGWNHDGKLEYLPPARQVRRMERIAARFRGLGLLGMRTPWYCRSPDLSQVMARYFAYDTSIPTTSAFFASRCNTGCCTIFPWEPAPGLIELPLTLPPDTAVAPGDGWETVLGLAEAIVARGGVIVVILHPQPHQSATPEGLRGYFGFLEELVSRFRGRLWSGTPAEVVRCYAAAISSPPRPVPGLAPTP